jgi:hypothetical protein
MTQSLRLTAAALAAGALLAACGTAAAGPGSPPATSTAKPVVHPITIRPTHSGNCGALSLDLAPGYKGYSTPTHAITAFLASGTATFPLPKSGWTTHDHRSYTSGTAHLQMMHIPHGGYAVNEASNC